jgi:hypothetical protein
LLSSFVPFWVKLKVFKLEYDKYWNYWSYSFMACWYSCRYYRYWFISHFFLWFLRWFRFFSIRIPFFYKDLKKKSTSARMTIRAKHELSFVHYTCLTRIREKEYISVLRYSFFCAQVILPRLVVNSP